MIGGALPVTDVTVDGTRCRALVDSGCTENLVHAPVCRQWRRQRTAVTTMNGSPFHCSGVGTVCLSTMTGQTAEVNVLVLEEPPMGLDLVIGVPGISALGGVTVGSPSDVRFCGAACRSVPTVDTPDFTVKFDPVEKSWTVAWKWRDGAEPAFLRNRVPQYSVSAEARQEYDAELETWIENGWLTPYDEAVHGRPRGLIPLMAIEQGNKSKVRPVLDYRELNSHVPAHTADADVCADTLRRWRRHGANVAIVDLKRAYLQLKTDPRLWPFQTVVIGGTRYALTRVGFGLNVAPLIMKAVVRAVLQQDSDVDRATIPYVDDLCVNEDIISADQVVEHFRTYGLECKPPERASHGARLLGLRVEAGGGTLQWARDNDVGEPPGDVTRRSVFAWCGRLVAHLPVCGWLRPAAAWLKRRANAVTQGWDDVTDDPGLRDQLRYVSQRLASEDPARGRWCVDGESAVIWTDASSVAAGVVLETPEGDAIEDACWLRRDETAHINMAELDAALRGLNLAIAWKMTVIELKTDSSTVHRWITDAISGRARLRTKAHGEMLIRRRVDTIKQLVEELKIDLTVTLVRSAENKADCISRVPAEWLRVPDSAPEPVCAAAGVDNASDGAAENGGNDVDVSETASRQRAIQAVHARAGHPGIRRTLYFSRRDVSPTVTRREVRPIVTQCDVCRSIDPAPVKWRHGALHVLETWSRLAIDITHHRGQLYLTVVDCGPSRFSLWRRLRRADTAHVVDELDQVFHERGAAAEILADNDTAFRSRGFAVFAAKWGVRLRFPAVHQPSGNGIVERNHRSVKVIAARKQCSVSEAVHLYNVTPLDGERADSSPAAQVYRYAVRDVLQAEAVDRVNADSQAGAGPGQDDGQSGSDYAVGDEVWVRVPGSRCGSKSRSGVVTGGVSAQVIEVDGTPWHVRDVRRRKGERE